jgi:hypothetical protein
MNVQLSRQILDKYNERENIAHTTLPAMNAQFPNQGNCPYEFSNINDVLGQSPHQGHWGDGLHYDGHDHSLPPYQRDMENYPRHQHCGEGQYTPQIELMGIAQEQTLVPPKVSQSGLFPDNQNAKLHKRPRLVKPNSPLPKYIPTPTDPSPTCWINAQHDQRTGAINTPPDRSVCPTSVR